MLKLYKSTLTTCFWIGVFCVILSISMEIYQFSIIENYAVGIACSCFVVIVTTALQLHKEKSEADSKMFSAIEQTLFHIQLALPDEQGQELNDYQYDQVFELINNANTITNARKAVYDLCQIHKNKYLKLWQAIARMELEFLSGDPKQKKTAVQNIIKADIVIPVIDEYLALNITDNISKDSIQKIRKGLSNFQTASVGCCHDQL